MKIRKKDIEKAKKTLKNYNAKILRKRNQLYKAGEDFEYLPERIMWKDFKKEMNNKSRKEFNNQIERMEKISKLRGSLDKVSFGKNDNIDMIHFDFVPMVNKIKTMVNKENIRRKKLRDKYNLDSSDVTPQNTHDSQVLIKKKFNLNQFKSKKELEVYVKNLEITTKRGYDKDRAERYKKAYLSALKNNMEGVNKDKLKELIESLPSNVVSDAYWSRDPILNINFTSDPLDGNLMVNQAIDHWLDWLDNNNIKYDKSIFKDYDPDEDYEVGFELPDGEEDFDY